MANLKDLIVNGSARILGTLYAPDIKNTSRITEFIVGTQTASTGSWTGKTQDTVLYDGKNINYFLPYAGSGNASLNLTLSNGTTTGAKPVYRWGTSYVTTHYPVNSCINMTYNATKGAWFVDADYDVNDWTNKVCWNNYIYAVTAITAGKLICGTKDGYKHIESGITFDITYPLLYAGSNINASANGTNNFLIFPGVNLQTTKASWTGTQKSMVFLVGTLSGTTFTIDSSVFTTTVPTTANGKVYMPIGILYSTYQIYFAPSSDLYAYFNGSFQPLQPDVGIDNTTITKNASSKLQTIGVIDQNNTANAIKTWTGTKAQYDAIVTKDGNTLYNIIDDTDVTFQLLELLFPIGAVYFGTMSVCPLETLGVGTWQALPQDKVIQIAGTRGSVGDTLNESLPNITGGFYNRAFGSGTANGIYGGAGCFSNADITASGGYYNVTGSGSNISRKISLNASRSSSTYQDNAPVQQDAYLLNGWRRIA